MQDNNFVSPKVEDKKSLVTDPGLLMKKNFITIAAYAWIGFIPFFGLLIIPLGLTHMIVMLVRGISALYHREFDQAGAYLATIIIIPLIGYGVCAVGLRGLGAL